MKLKIDIENSKKRLLNSKEVRIVEEIKQGLADMIKQLETVKEDLVVAEEFLEEVLAKC